MESLYILIPVTFLLLFIAIIAWLWSVRSGQLQDLDKEASRILFEDIESSELTPHGIAERSDTFNGKHDSQ